MSWVVKICVVAVVPADVFAAVVGVVVRVGVVCYDFRIWFGVIF